MQQTFAEKVIAFNLNLHYDGNLPEGFRVLNPFSNNSETREVMQAFYQKYYNDYKSRKFIIGINPGRHGAGVTGIPFTDTKRLKSVCGINMQSAHTHEISSVFIYDMIAAFGGAELFYQNYYINSPFPLAIIRQDGNDRWLNANYYDDKELFKMVSDFMIDSLKQHIALGLDCSEVYVLGKKNADFIKKLNKKGTLFERIVILEHPRYIQQYKSKERERYIQKYLQALQPR
ncbi:MAG: SMUG2 DNA glycosylase family protein [Fermentimonas sp.]|jgi:hypothetical protein